MSIFQFVPKLRFGSKKTYGDLGRIGYNRPVFRIRYLIALGAHSFQHRRSPSCFQFYSLFAIGWRFDVARTSARCFHFNRPYGYVSSLDLSWQAIHTSRFAISMRFRISYSALRITCSTLHRAPLFSLSICTFLIYSPASRRFRYFTILLLSPWSIIHRITSVVLSVFNMEITHMVKYHLFKFRNVSSAFPISTIQFFYPLRIFD